MLVDIGLFFQNPKFFQQGIKELVSPQGFLIANNHDYILDKFNFQGQSFGLDVNRGHFFFFVQNPKFFQQELKEFVQNGFLSLSIMIMFLTNLTFSINVLV